MQRLKLNRNAANQVKHSNCSLKSKYTQSKKCHKSVPQLLQFQNRRRIIVMSARQIGQALPICSR